MSTTPVVRPAGSSVKSLDVTFMVANAVGIVLYLLLASRGWRIPQEHGWFLSVGSLLCGF